MSGAITTAGRPRRTRATGWIVVIALALATGLTVAALTYQSSGSRASTAAAQPITQASYGLVTVIVHPPTGPARTWRFLRADTTPLIEHGLMHDTDATLGGHHGMLFEFAAPTTVPFWMRNTPLPLTVAFIGADGAMQSRAVDMSPCGDSPTCPAYAASAPYLYALEVPQHHLAALGMVPGSTIEVPSR
jgi:uncharacterized membrane protein (UPF0127 family)